VASDSLPQKRLLQPRCFFFHPNPSSIPIHRNLRICFIRSRKARCSDDTFSRSVDWEAFCIGHSAHCFSTSDALMHSTSAITWSVRPCVSSDGRIRFVMSSCSHPSPSRAVSPRAGGLIWDIAMSVVIVKMSKAIFTLSLLGSVDGCGGHLIVMSVLRAR